MKIENNKGSALVIGLVIVGSVVILGLAYGYNRNNSNVVSPGENMADKAMMEKNDDSMMEDDPEAMMDKMEDKDDAMMEKNDDSMMEEDKMMDNSDDAMMEYDSDAMMEKNDDSMMEDDSEAMMEKNDDSMMEDKETSMNDGPGKYITYSPAAYTASQNEKRVLFFHAAWCPTCKSANQDISSKSGQIPAGVTILKTDYDTEKELKKKYGITYQHTFVQVDAEGNEVAKWNGGGMDTILARIK